MFNLFHKRTPEAEAKEQLDDARLQAVIHEAAAEHHAALACMYRMRITRLINQGAVNDDDTIPSRSVF